MSRFFSRTWWFRCYYCGKFTLRFTPVDNWRSRRWDPDFYCKEHGA